MSDQIIQSTTRTFNFASALQTIVVMGSIAVFSWGAGQISKIQTLETTTQNLSKRQDNTDIIISHINIDLATIKQQTSDTNDTVRQIAEKMDRNEQK